MPLIKGTATTLHRTYCSIEQTLRSFSRYLPVSVVYSDTRYDNHSPYRVHHTRFPRNPAFLIQPIDTSQGLLAMGAKQKGGGSKPKGNTADEVEETLQAVVRETHGLEHAPHHACFFTANFLFTSRFLRIPLNHVLSRLLLRSLAYVTHPIRRFLRILYKTSRGSRADWIA